MMNRDESPWIRVAKILLAASPVVTCLLPLV
jgi:hypothetical protein